MIKVFVNLCHNKPHGKVVNNLFISTPIAYETEHQLAIHRSHFKSAHSDHTYLMQSYDVFSGATAVTLPS